MANKTAILIRRCKTPTGWRRLPVVVGGNGKLRPGYALFEGKPTLFPDGSYQIRYYEGKATKFLDAGNDAAEALAAQKRYAHLLIARQAAVSAGVEVVAPESKRAFLSKKKDEYVQRHLAKGQKRASVTARIAIEGFIEATGHLYADQVTESSVLGWYAELRKSGNQDRTIYNKHVSVFGWLKWMGVDTKSLAAQPPKFTEREVDTFQPDELRALLAASDAYQKIVFETLLKTGLRMQEAMHLEWRNVDFKAKRIKVRERLDGDGEDVRIKDRAERSVPLPDDLGKSLEAWKEVRPGTTFVLGTKNDTPNWKWLVMLKRLVRTAGLNCERCPGCRGTGECARWRIHKFRATYTTGLLRAGLDVRTVIQYTGHADLATVMRYLAPAEDASTQARVSAIAWM